MINSKNKPLYLLCTIDSNGHPEVLLEESINRVRLEQRGNILWREYSILTDIFSARTMKAQLMLIKDRFYSGLHELPECVRETKTSKFHIRMISQLLDSMFEGWIEECDEPLFKQLEFMRGISQNHYRAYDLINEAYMIAGEIYDKNRAMNV